MAKTEPFARHHGVKPRGPDNVPRSSIRDGFFGRMFRTLPPLEANAGDLLELACSMIDKQKTDEEKDEFNNHDLPAGYTYVGQFIDHDVTFDPTSRLQRLNDPDALTNFRTPRLDLDSLYGSGPADSPFLYDPDGTHFRIGHITGGAADLPREAPVKPGDDNRRALIGDPRNDENTIISQLHLAFLQFHNLVVDTCTSPNLSADILFETCQRTVRWHYQWMVVHDFLPRIVDEAVIDDILGCECYDTPARQDKHGVTLGSNQKGKLYKPNLRFFVWHNQPFMPVEFAAAAYRFGHSMIRADYALNHDTAGKNELDLFTLDNKEDLRGFRERPSLLTIEWPFLFQFPAMETDPGRPQPARKIDTRLNFNLSIIPGGPTRASDPELAILLGQKVEGVLDAADKRSNNADEKERATDRFKQRQIGQILPVRNLLRGQALGLPSGQDVARTMGIPDGLILDPDSFSNLDPHLRTTFGEATPLWYYILKEAEVLNEGLRLGPVGGRIVAEVLIGLLWGDRLSYLRAAPGWQPTVGQFCTRPGKNGAPHFGITELLDAVNPRR